MRPVDAVINRVARLHGNQVDVVVQIKVRRGIHTKMLCKHFLTAVSGIQYHGLRQAAYEHINAEIRLYGLPIVAGEDFHIDVGVLLVKIAESGNEPQAGKCIGQLQTDAVVSGVWLQSGNVLLEFTETQVTAAIQLLACGGEGDFVAVSVPQVEIQMAFQLFQLL